MWICPDIQNFTIQGDPKDVNYGTDFIAVVNTCENFKKLASKQNLYSYVENDENLECYDQSESESWIDNIGLTIKMISTSFNPEYFA